VVCRWHRYGHVDADHADIDPPGKIPGRIPVPGKNGRTVAVLVTIDQLESCLIVRHTHHAEHRSENLFLIDFHVRLHMVEQTSADEKTLLPAAGLLAASVHHQSRTLLDTTVHIAGDFG